MPADQGGRRVFEGEQRWGFSLASDDAVVEDRHPGVRPSRSTSRRSSTGTSVPATRTVGHTRMWMTIGATTARMTRARSAVTRIMATRGVTPIPDPTAAATELARSSAPRAGTIPGPRPLHFLSIEHYPLYTKGICNLKTNNRQTRLITTLCHRREAPWVENGLLY